MNKEVNILVKLCESNKSEFSVDEIATIANLKFVEGVYPYLRLLQKNNFIIKESKGTYKLNEASEKVKTVKLLLKVFGKDAELLFTVHTKNLLERFSITPIVKASDLPQHNLKTVKQIAKKTKIFYSTPQGKSEVHFIRSWEEPTKKLLSFFDIKLQFDEEEHKNKVIRAFSAFTGKQKHLSESQLELSKLNVDAHIKGHDQILNNLKNFNIPELNVLDILTDKKKQEYRNNPFEITKKIADWKILYVYNTDKIEGNILTYDEVRTILTLGSEFVKKEKKDVLETTNSRTALENIFDTSNEVSIDFIKKLHKATQQGIDLNAGEFKKEENCIINNGGEIVDTTTPVQFVEEMMDSLVEWYAKNQKTLHPIVLASVIHNQFAYIHPFSDGNGRVARLLFNFILIKKGYFPLLFFNDEKQKYYVALRQTHDGDMKPFIFYVADLYRTQLDRF